MLFFSHFKLFMTLFSRLIIPNNWQSLNYNQFSISIFFFFYYSMKSNYYRIYLQIFLINFFSIHQQKKCPRRQYNWQMNFSFLNIQIINIILTICQLFFIFLNGIATGSLTLSIILVIIFYYTIKSVFAFVFVVFFFFVCFVVHVRLYLLISNYFFSSKN